jgi:hypothetical protein
MRSPVGAGDNTPFPPDAAPAKRTHMTEQKPRQPKGIKAIQNVESISWEHLIEATALAKSTLVKCLRKGMLPEPQQIRNERGAMTWDTRDDAVFQQLKDFIERKNRKGPGYRTDIHGD